MKNTVKTIFVLLLATIFLPRIHLVSGMSEWDRPQLFTEINSETGQGVELGNVFFTHSEYAHYIVNFSYVGGHAHVKFRWYNPVGELYFSENFTTYEPGLIRSSLSIHGCVLSLMPGEWEVRIEITSGVDGFSDSKTFQIVEDKKYDSLLTELSGVRNMMYISSAVSVILLIATIYLYFKKS